MRSVFEYMTTIFIMMILSFVCISIISIESQEVYARNYHTRVIELVQNKGDYNNLKKEDYDEHFDFELEDGNTIKITYSYDIVTPFLGTFKDRKIIGFAR